MRAYLHMCALRALFFSLSIQLHLIKHKLTNVGRIALERQAGGKSFDPGGIRTIDLPLHNPRSRPIKNI